MGKEIWGVRDREIWGKVTEEECEMKREKKDIEGKSRARLIDNLYVLIHCNNGVAY